MSDLKRIAAALYAEAQRIEALVRDHPGMQVPDHLCEGGKANMFLVVADSLRHVAESAGEDGA